MTLTRRTWPALCWLVVCSSCVTTLYEGPRKPASETALVESRDTVIDELDGKDVQKIRGESTVYLLPPGPHVIGFRLLQVDTGLFTTRVASSSQYIRACLLAEAQHRYLTAGRIAGRAWTPEILDRGAGQLPIDCDRARLFPAPAPAS